MKPNAKKTTKAKPATKPAKVAARAKRVAERLTPRTPEEVMPNAAARAAMPTLPCPACGEELTAKNRSVLTSGKVVHIGCPKATHAAPTVKDGKGRPALSGLPKQRGVKPPKPPAPPPPPKYGDVEVKADYQGRTCLQVKRDVNTVTYVPLDTVGLHLTYLPREKFDARFQTLRGYSTERAVAHYVRMALDYGATRDVLDHLSKVQKMSEEERQQAMLKLTTQSTEGEANMGTGKAKTKKVGKKTSQGPKKPGSGARIREMLLKGMESEEILKVIHKEFPDSTAKSSDVSWNRGKLRKDGLLKEEKAKPAAKAAAKGKAKKAA